VITSWALDIGEVMHDLNRTEGGSSIEPDWEKRAAVIQEEEHMLANTPLFLRP
jgi:hypothetical protein